MGEYCLKTSLHLFGSNNTLDSFSILLDILFYPYECFLFYTPRGVKVPVWGKSFIILGKTIISQLHIFSRSIRLIFIYETYVGDSHR